MVGRALGHPVASGTAIIGMGCARLTPQRRGAKRPRYGGNFGGCLAIGIVPGNREEVGTHFTSIGDPHIWDRSALLADQPKGGERNEEPKDNKYPASPQAACQGVGRELNKPRLATDDDEGRQIGW